MTYETHVPTLWRLHLLKSQIHIHKRSCRYILCIYICNCFKFKDDESYYHNKLENIVLMQFYEY